MFGGVETSFECVFGVISVLSVYFVRFQYVLDVFMYISRTFSVFGAF